MADTRDARSRYGRKLLKSYMELEEFIYIVEYLHIKLEDEDFELMGVEARNKWIQSLPSSLDVPLRREGDVK